MTLAEFDRNITAMSDVFVIASDYDFYDELGLFDVVPEDEINERIHDDLLYAVGEWSWDTIRDYLSDIPTYTETGYYWHNGTLDFTDIEYSDMTDYISRLCRLMIDNDLFEDEEDDDTEIPHEKEQEHELEDSLECAEDFNMNDLYEVRYA